MRRGLDARALPWVLVAAVVAIGGWIRLRSLDRLSFRVDEGYTLIYARQSWSGVLGLDGFCAPHPPLYFALAKAANALLREEIAGRAVAAAAGTLSILLVYWIVAELADPLAGALAALGTALSPTLIEFSRDGRMYAPVIVAVLLAYAALVQFDRCPGPWPALGYAGALVLAIYLDYSAAYALVPQGLYLLALVRRHGRAARWLVAALGAAAFAYLPWLPQLLDTVRTVGATGDATGRDDYLGASWSAIAASVPQVLGIDGRGSSAMGVQNAWDRWPDARLPLLVLFAALAFGGCWALRHSRLLPITVGLTLGTPLTAAAASLISPGYATRTVQIAAIGWCMLAGCGLAALARAERRPRLARGIAVAAGGAVVAVWLVTLPATLSSVGRYDWREIAALITAPDHPGATVLTLSNMGMATDVLELYGGEAMAQERIVTLTDGRRERWTGADRWLARGPSRAQVADGALDPLLPPGPETEFVWFVTRLGDSTVAPALERLGYTRLTETTYRGATVSLWQRTNAPEA